MTDAKNNEKTLTMWQWLANPLRRSEARLEGEIDRHLNSFPVPVFWLIGKAQAGKSSIVRTLTGYYGSTDRAAIAIGEGYRPCTTRSSMYEFPSSAAPLIKFLDTRGLFESGYDPSDDIAVCEESSHLLVVVVRVDDHATATLLDLLEKIQKRKPQWPMLLVLTCLHTTYRTGEHHVEPYPYSESSNPLEHIRTREHIELQKKTFARFNPKVVPVDFTREEDGYPPVDYGREYFLSVAESLLPEVTWNVIRELSGSALATEWVRAAQPLILAYSLAAGSAAALPVPFIDIPLVSGIQLKMLHGIAAQFEQKLDRRTITEIVSVVGTGVLLRLGAREFLKFVPGGSLISSAYSASVTYALGNVFVTYFTLVRQGHKPKPEELRRIYNERVARGRTLFAGHHENP
jgi:uncharacterized protein (DUF697 family)